MFWKNLKSGPPFYIVSRYSKLFQNIVFNYFLWPFLGTGLFYYIINWRYNAKKDMSLYRINHNLF